MDVFKTARAVSAIEAANRLGLRGRRTGERMVMRCLFHEDKTPSMVLYPRDGGFHCFGCGRSGDATALYQQALGLPPLEAARRVCEDFQLKWTEDWVPSRRIAPRREPDARKLMLKLQQFRERRAALLVDRRTQAQTQLSAREKQLEEQALPFEQWWDDAEWARAKAAAIDAEEELMQLDSMTPTELWQLYRDEHVKEVPHFGKQLGRA